MNVFSLNRRGFLFVSRNRNSEKKHLVNFNSIVIMALNLQQCIDLLMKHDQLVVVSIEIMCSSPLRGYFTRDTEIDMEGNNYIERKNFFILSANWNP